ncbi:hypothetical protein [Maribacter ulvicola]|uniref:Cytochrome C and Quinol oxidase polypeptide I n=1 Tax=Maribacter ulvicola TaxID=228959 RepID=A0A1N6Z9F7_9FLAO|nr:hypothetical protein [Maribacter ulvicola]SIR23421.1 hypothetical protein SAMN05421797_10890 [Maribacter ulvicola]
MAIQTINLKVHTKIALGYFVLAALLGCVLRFFKVFDIPVTYKFIVHTHSHIALLGWVYLALTALLYKLYLSKAKVHKTYSRIFWFTQITLLGMLFSFPFQGYAAFSIIFSTLFLFASYWFAWFFFKHVPLEYSNVPSLKFAKAAIFYLLLSSIGPWVLGVVMKTLGATSIWYRLAIYFYLHFLYNGWMIMALITVLLYAFEKKHHILAKRSFNNIFIEFNLGIIFSFCLSTLFTQPSALYYVFGGLGAVLQLWAFYNLVVFLKVAKVNKGRMYSSLHQNILKIVAILWAVKMGLQLLSSLPYFANMAVVYLDFTIGYLHWTFLGVVTLSLFLFLDNFKLLSLNKKMLWLYVLGFLLTEALIFYKAIMSWQEGTLFPEYSVILAIASLVLLVAVLGILLSSNRLKIKH